MDKIERVKAYREERVSPPPMLAALPPRAVAFPVRVLLGWRAELRYDGRVLATAWGLTRAGACARVLRRCTSPDLSPS